MRVGIGYDVHKLVENRALILGGVEILWEKGLLGHSDADVLLHAIMDALLGAAALGDIGKHFPDTDPKYKGISSIKLLEHVGALLEENGYADETPWQRYRDQRRRDRASGHYHIRQPMPRPKCGGPQLIEKILKN